MKIQYEICTRCVMDTSDPDIFFDEQGICNHCHEYDTQINNYINTNIHENKIEHIIDEIKRKGAGKEYDCIIGVSGGLDSSYLAYITKKCSLRPLAVHVDNGWNSETSVLNIQNLLSTLSIDLDTVVLDWDEFRDIQIAFLKSGTPDVDIPADHAIMSTLLEKAREYGVHYLICGDNIRTESHGVRAWSQGYNDWKYICSVHDLFGTKQIKSFPHNSFLRKVDNLFRIKWVPLLNYINYSKKKAIKTLEEEIGWRPYGEKHYESIYTRFIHGYYLPQKFGYDHRRCHLSSLICSGEVTREESIEILKEPPYPPELIREDKEYVLQKLGITEWEFEEILYSPNRTIYDYPSYQRLLMKSLFYRIIRKIYRMRRE